MSDNNDEERESSARYLSKARRIAAWLKPYFESTMVFIRNFNGIYGFAGIVVVLVVGLVTWLNPAKSNFDYLQNKVFENCSAKGFHKDQCTCVCNLVPNLLE